MRPYVHFRAHPALQAVVSGFSQRCFDNAQGPVIALPARTDAFIEFYLAETYQVRMSNAQAAAPVPETTLVAPHTRAKNSPKDWRSITICGPCAKPWGWRAPQF